MARHHGLISRSRARELGVTDRQIDGRVRARQWRRVLPTVFADCSALRTAEQRLAAAVLWAGPRAVASHLSAAWLWGLLDRAPDRPWVTTGERRAAMPGVHVAFSRDVTRLRCVEHRGIRCTTQPRTICDCAAVLSPAALERALDRAVAAHKDIISTLEQQLAPGGDLQGRRGADRLRRAMSAGGYGGSHTRTPLESSMRRALLAAGVDGLIHEHTLVLEGITWSLDFSRPDLRIAWEAQSDAYHSSPEAQRRDARKANALGRAGWTARFYTHHQLTHERERVVAEMAADYAAAKERAARRSA